MENTHYEVFGKRLCAWKSVVDVETTQLLEDVGNNPEKLTPCVVGIFCRENIIQIYLGLDEDLRKFKDEIRQKLAPLPKPLLAFNSKFDSQVLFGFLNKQYDFEEIQEFERQKKAVACANYGISVPDLFNDDGKKVIEYYKKYLESKDFKYMEDILKHNRACLSKEYQIYLNVKEKNSKINIYLYTKHNPSNQLVLYVKVKNLIDWHRNFYDKIAKKGFEYDELESKDCKIILQNESFTQEIISFLNQEFKLYRPKYHPELYKQIFNNSTQFRYYISSKEESKERNDEDEEWKDEDEGWDEEEDL